MPRPRIAFVTYAMYCGGMETFLLRLAKYLDQQGCDVEVITTIEPGEWFGQLSNLHIKAHHISGYRQSGLLDPFRHSDRVSAQLTAGHYDVIFLNHTRHAQAILARLAERVIAIPILHNDVAQIYQVGCANQDAWNAAVAVSPRVAGRARERVPRRPVVEITSGVVLPSPEQWQDRRQFSRPLELIFIGRLEHGQKGVLFLPDIYKACLDRGMDASLTIVGDGPDAPELHRKLSHYRLQGTTRHLRGLTPEEVYALLLASHILLMPSHYEGLPIALLESLACGCVPVASRLPGITDVAVTHGETGMLADAGQVHAYAEAIATLYNDPARWSRMSSAARESAGRRFSVEAMGRSYLALINEALNGRYPLPRPRKHQPGLDLAVFSWRDFLPEPVRQLGRRGRAWLRNLSPADSHESRGG
jgi:glycosyltransferase involved in cell wall biosynthesis